MFVQPVHEKSITTPRVLAMFVGPAV